VNGVTWAPGGGRLTACAADGAVVVWGLRGGGGGAGARAAMAHAEGRVGGLEPGRGAGSRSAPAMAAWRCGAWRAARGWRRCKGAGLRVAWRPDCEHLISDGVDKMVVV
jgi:hypothetical protein